VVPCLLSILLWHLHIVALIYGSAGGRFTYKPWGGCGVMHKQRGTSYSGNGTGDTQVAHQPKELQDSHHNGEGDQTIQLIKRAAVEHEHALLSLARDLEMGQKQLAAAENERINAIRERDEARAALEAAEARSIVTRQRACDLAEQLKNINRALFTQNVPELILKACLQLTTAGRGWFIQAAPPGATGAPSNGAQMHVVAAIGDNTHPHQPLTEFLRLVCSKVIEENVPVGSGSPGADAPTGLSRPFPENSEDGADPPRDWIAAPAVLLGKPMGVVIVADKSNGDFNEGDLDMLLSVGDQASVAVENSRLHQRLEQAYLATIRILADAMEAKDPHTQGHCEQVAQYARLTAARLGLSTRETATVCFAALLHDIGKIGVSDGVLNKPGPLLPEERTLVQAHVRIGRDLIARVPSLTDVGSAIYHHHEAWNGRGYPDGLKGDAIPVASRIVAVVDAYCAMTSRRSYKEALDDSYARAELLRCAGTQFEPAVIDAFLSALDDLNHQQSQGANTTGTGAEHSTAEGTCGFLPPLLHSLGHDFASGS
jgi:HD-GYP domain-containing protein (c-di-GMP phosphodiesterase class II)